jgi:GNAT superfamily N-acetyltransferase
MSNPETLIEIEHVAAGPRLEEVRELFREYASSLDFDLAFQGFAEELANLPGEYAAPGGTLLLALVEAGTAGCVAVRRFDEDTCEMKRLFVRGQFRGRGCGKVLAQRAIEWANGAGYRRMLLDTIPSMVRAQNLYLDLGFKDIGSYRFNPIEGARFMELRWR